jgi:hypothetical protein
MSFDHEYLGKIDEIEKQNEKYMIQIEKLTNQAAKEKK